MWRAPIGTPWFVPALVAVWGPLAASLLWPAAPPPARDVVARAVTVALEEAAKARPGLAGQVEGGAATVAEPSEACTCPPAPLCPEPEECSAERLAAKWGLTWPNFGWSSIVVIFTALRALEGAARAACRRRYGIVRRGVAVPALAHY